MSELASLQDELVNARGRSPGAGLKVALEQ